MTTDSVMTSRTSIGRESTIARRGPPHRSAARAPAPHRGADPARRARAGPRRCSSATACRASPGATRSRRSPRGARRAATKVALTVAAVSRPEEAARLGGAAAPARGHRRDRRRRSAMLVRPRGQILRFGADQPKASGLEALQRARRAGHGRRPAVAADRRACSTSTTTRPAAARRSASSALIALDRGRAGRSASSASPRARAGRSCAALGRLPADRRRRPVRPLHAAERRRRARARPSDVLDGPRTVADAARRSTA